MIAGKFENKLSKCLRSSLISVSLFSLMNGNRFTRFSSQVTFRESLNTTGIIPRIVSKLEDDDEDVCIAADAALKAFNAHGWSSNLSQI